MSNSWALAPQSGAGFDIPLTQVTHLMRKLGLTGRHAVAEELLRLVGSHVPLAQCTIFSYAGQGRPRIVAVGDRARTKALPRISQDYVSRFYPLDGSVQVMQAELAAARRASAAHPLILLHHGQPCAAWTPVAPRLLAADKAQSGFVDFQIGHSIAFNIHQKLKFRRGGIDIVSGVVLRGECIVRCAVALQEQIKLITGVFFRTFEHHVLKQMGDASKPCFLVL